MGKMIIEVDQPGVVHAEYRIFEQDEVRVGRSFDNDLILSDAFVDPHHLVITAAGQGWECRDCGSVNGTYVSISDGDTKKRLEAQQVLRSGDSLIVGKTVLRVWAADHPVAKAVAIDHEVSELYVDRRKSRRELIVTLVGYFLFSSLWMYGTQIRKDTTWLKMLAASAFLFIPFLMWAGGWALITKFSKRRHRFTAHLMVLCKAVLFAFLISYPAAYIAFLYPSYGLVTLGALLLFGVWFFVILKGHLSIATNMTYRGQNWLAGTLTGVILLLCALTYHVGKDAVKLFPDHNFYLMPMPSLVIPADSATDVLGRVDGLFKPGTDR